MSIDVLRQGNRFQYRFTPDDKLPEGRISLPISLQFLPGDPSTNQPSLPFPPLGIAQMFEFDARTFQGVTSFTSFKSVDFLVEFFVAQPSDNPRLYLYSPDSSDFHLIDPATPNDPATVTATMAYVEGTLPIVSNGSTIQIIADISTNVEAGTAIFASFSLNNFFKPPYVFQSTSAKTDYR